MTTKRDATVSLRIPAELKDKLQGLADADGRTLSAYVVRILERAVKDEE